MAEDDKDRPENQGTPTGAPAPLRTTPPAAMQPPTAPDVGSEELPAETTGAFDKSVRKGVPPEKMGDGGETRHPDKEPLPDPDPKDHDADGDADLPPPANPSND